MTLRPRTRPGPLLGDGGTGDFGVSPPEPRFRKRALSLSSFDIFVRVSPGLFVLSMATCFAMNSPTSCLEIDDFLSPMLYSLENADVDFSLSTFPSSSLSESLFGSGPSIQIKVGFSMKTYAAEILGGGFLVFPIFPPKALPNKLRRSPDLLSKLLLVLLWALGESSTESRLVEV